MQVIITKRGNFYHLKITNIIGRLLYSYNTNNINDMFEAIYKILDSKIIPLKSKALHFIDFIKPIMISSNLKVYNHKAKSFNKNYGNDKNYNNKIENKIIAKSFLSSFKATKSLSDFYMYLKYCNAYKDFSKVRI